MRETVAGNVHLFQQPDFIKENSKGVKELVAGNEHLFQQPEFIKENRGGKGKMPRKDKSSRSLPQKGEHQIRMLVMLRKKALDNGLQDSNIY